MVKFIKYQNLIYAGAIPFVLAAFALAMGLENLGPLGSTQGFINSYALAIVSFMSGTTWAHALQHQDTLKHTSSMLIISNVLVLLCWFSFLTDVLSLLLPAMCFLILLVVDFYFYRVKIIEKTYWLPRVFVTVIVVVSLVFTWMIKD